MHTHHEACYELKPKGLAVQLCSQICVSNRNVSTGVMQDVTKTALAVHAQRSAPSEDDDWIGTTLLHPILHGAIKCVFHFLPLHVLHMACMYRI